jgi:hypothetical protein
MNDGKKQRVICARCGKETAATGRSLLFPRIHYTPPNQLGSEAIPCPGTYEVALELTLQSEKK